MAVDVFGAISVILALATWLLQPRSHWFTFGFAGASVCVAVYAFERGVWPVGVLESVWYLVAMRRWVDRQAYE